MIFATLDAGRRRLAIALRSAAMRGVEIAPHVAVGANPVVTRSIPERGVYGGASARLLVRSAGAV